MPVTLDTDDPTATVAESPKASASQSSDVVLLTAKQRTVRSFWALLLGGVFLAAGLMVIGCGYQQISYAVHSPDWPTVIGQVVSSEVVEDTDADSHSYWPRVEYTYEVAGKKLLGDELAFVQSGVGAKWARKKVKEYRRGKDITVYYQPTDSAVSVLEPGAKASWFVTTLAVIAAFTGVFFLLAWLLLGDYKKVRNAVRNAEGLYPI